MKLMSEAASGQTLPYSFHPVKMITTGEGGMATTNSKLIYEKIEMYKNHGITRDQKD